MVDYSRAERHRGFESLSLRKKEASEFFLMPFFVAVANRGLTVLSVASLGESAPLGSSANPSLSANKRHQFFLMPFFVAVANRGLTVLSVASLGESAPTGRARIPLSPQKEQPHGLLFFAYANRVLTVLSVASLGESAPLGRARIPLSPQKEQPHGLLFLRMRTAFSQFFQSLRLVKAPHWVERESLSLRKKSNLMGCFFFAYANRVLTVLSVASLGESAPTGRARIPLSPQTRGISFF